MRARPAPDMRRLTDHTEAGHIRLNFRAAGKDEALEALGSLAAGARRLPRGEVLAVLKARETLGSTAVGGGIALPHGRLPGLPRPVLALAVSPEGVDFDSLDGRPVHIFALLLTARDGDANEHLQLLARLGALLKSPEAVAALLSARTPAEVLAFLARY